MDLSFVTSLYRSEKFLAGYLKHIESFNKKAIKEEINVEFILICNDSNKEEESILSSCKLSNLKIVNVPREGLYASWNRGIKEASAEVIAFWNVDDIRFFKAAINGVAEIRKGVELVYFPFIVLGITKVTIFKKKFRFTSIVFKIIKAERYDKAKFMMGCMCGPFFMFHRKVIEKIGEFDETFTIAGDYDWFARASFNDISFKNIRWIGGFFFVHSNNISGRNFQRHVSENERVTNRYYLKFINLENQNNHI